MKPYVVTAILAGLLFLGLIYLYAVEFPDAERKAEAGRMARQLIHFQSDDVRSMTLQYRGQESIRVGRGPDGEWLLVEPLHYRADQAEVEDIIRDLVLAKVTRVIDDPDSNLGDYGMAPPQLTLSVALADRSEEFLIGEKGPVSSQLYFKRRSEPQIYLTNLPDRDILSKTPYVLRWKELVDADRENVERVTLEYPTGTFSLFKAESVWFLDAPVESQADQSVVGALLFQLENLKAGQFIDGLDEKEMIRGSLHLPELVVHLQANGIPYAVQIFENANDPEMAYVITTPDLPVFLVPRATLQRIPSTLFMLRDKRLVAVDQSRVTELEVTTQDQPLTLSLESEQHPRPHPVREFMNRVLTLRAEILVQGDVATADLHALGLDTPALEVKLLGADSVVLGSVAVSGILSAEDGGQAGSANARGSTLPGVYGIRSSILTNIPTNLAVTVPTDTP